MTILFLSRLFYPHIGGVEKHAMEVGKRLVKRGFKVVLLTERLDNKRFCSNVLKHQNKREETIEGIKVIRIPVDKDGWSKKFRIWRWLWRHQDLIQQADIVHCHDVFFWYLPFRFLYPQKPVYTTFHGYETKFPPSKKAILVRKISEKLSWGNICVGDYIKKWYHTSPTFITYGGVNIDKIRNPKSETNSKFQIPNSKLQILFIGRLEEDTGILTYLKALGILQKMGINFGFEICGDGSLRKETERWGKVNGFVENLESYIKKSRFVFTSSYLSILEAMVQKKLVFAVYENPLKEDYLKMAPFAKWIVIEKDPEKIAERMKYYLSCPEEEEKTAEAAYNWVKNQTWEKVVDLYLRLWKQELTKDECHNYF